MSKKSLFQKNSPNLKFQGNERLDSGQIIMKKKVKVLKKDTPKSLAMKILKEENKLYPKAISKIISKI